MRVAGIDFETTGLSFENDRVTEIGLVLWDIEAKRPLTTVGVFLWDEGIKARMVPEVTEMMARISGITPAMLEEFGTDAKKNFAWLEGYCQTHHVEYLVAHNGRGFDRPMLLAELDRHGLEAPTLRSLPLVDTKEDLPFASEPDSRKLKHLALDSGFINHFPHRAVFDVCTMLKVMSHYDFEKVLAHRARPSIVVRAVVPSPRQDNGKGKDFAKSKGYRWQEWNYVQYPLQWVRGIKEDELEAEKEKMAPYQVVVLDKSVNV